MANSPLSSPLSPGMSSTCASWNNCQTAALLPSPSSPTGSSTTSNTTDTDTAASPPSSVSSIGSSSSTYGCSHEPFSAFQHKVYDLCIAIGLGTPNAVTQVGSGGFNHIVGVDIPNIPSAVVRIPRFAGYVLQGIQDQHAIRAFLGKAAIPVPETIAYDATIGGHLGCEYIIQHRIPGVSLEGIYEALDISEKKHVLSQVVDLLASMESIQFPATGHLVAADRLPDALVVQGSSTPYNAGVATAPFPRGLCERHEPGPTPTTLEDALADRLRAWDEECETRVGVLLAPMWERLSEIIVEMRSLGFFEQCCVAPNVLHHCDFELRNVMVERKNGLCKVTGVVDWDTALSVPLVLARKPPAWLWLSEEEMESSHTWWDGDFDEVELGEGELKTLFEQKMVEKVGVKYLEDALGKGRWIRRVWRFLLYGFMRDRDWKRFDRFVDEWNRYTEGRKSAA